MLSRESYCHDQLRGVEVAESCILCVLDAGTGATEEEAPEVSAAGSSNSLACTRVN